VIAKVFVSYARPNLQKLRWHFHVRHLVACVLSLCGSSNNSIANTNNQIWPDWLIFKTSTVSPLFHTQLIWCRYRSSRGRNADMNYHRDLSGYHLSLSNNSHFFCHFISLLLHYIHHSNFYFVLICEILNHKLFYNWLTLYKSCRYCVLSF